MILTTVTAFEAFEKVMSATQVVEAVPLVVCLDGPRKGWVYDKSSMDERDTKWGPSDTIYQYEGELMRDEENRLMLGYRHVMPEPAP